MIMVTEQHFSLAGITVFTLAYLSKGMRRSSMKTKAFVRTESVLMILDRHKREADAYYQDISKKELEERNS